MEIYAKGQLSYLILNCLLERDYYGLDIISEIKDRSNGRILLKKPSVYSNLTRMEKQGQVSSYVQSSELGPNRRYYSITEKGRDTFASLKDYFDRNGIDVFKDFNEEGSVVEAPAPAKQVELEESVEEQENESYEQSDFFDFSSLEPKEESAKVEEVVEDDGVFLSTEESFVEDAQEEKVEASVNLAEEKPENQENQVLEDQEKQYSIASLLKQTEEQAPTPTSQVPQEHVKIVEEVIITPEPIYQEETQVEKEPFIQPQLSNQQIYDISKDINKYKRKRSFAEDQMAFAVSDPLERDDEKTKQNIEELKSSILANKGKVNERLSEDEFNKVREHVSPNPQPVQTSAAMRNYYSSNFPTAQEKKEAPHSDDGVFIDQYMDNSQVAKARKIEPPRLKIMGEKETPLPAPKRDNSIDLSHKEIISKLYSKSKGGNGNGQVDENYIYDYEDLQDYYSSQGIAFKVYEKTNTKEKHNTNKLGFISSLICFGLSLVATAIIFTALYLTGNLMNATSFLFVAFPIIAGAECLSRFYVYKKHTSWEPKPMLSAWLVWLIALLGFGAIIGLNFAFGLNSENWLTFSTTLFLPAVYVLIYLPIYNFVKKTMIVKHWH